MFSKFINGLKNCREAKQYVRQCELAADGCEMKLRDYLRPSETPICLFTAIEKTTDTNVVTKGDFVTCRNDKNEELVLTFDTYHHANAMAEVFTSFTGTPVEAYKTDPHCVFLQEKPIVGASCTKSDGVIIETPKEVYKRLYYEITLKENLRAARVNELRKRRLND